MIRSVRHVMLEMELTEAVLQPHFSTATIDGARQFLENLIGYYVVMEGVFFYSGFAMMLSFHRQNRMTGVGQQFQYILRDESIHLNFGVDLINGLISENPELWTSALREKTVDRIKRAVNSKSRTLRIVSRTAFSD